MLILCLAFLKLFKYSFNSMTTLSGKPIAVTSVQKWKDWGTERLTKLPKFAQLRSDKVGFKNSSLCSESLLLNSICSWLSDMDFLPKIPSSKSLSWTLSMALYKREFRDPGKFSDKPHSTDLRSENCLTPKTNSILHQICPKNNNCRHLQIKTSW